MALVWQREDYRSTIVENLTAPQEETARYHKAA
jgi:hypothetical protein